MTDKDISIGFRIIIVVILLVIASDMRKMRRAIEFFDARITNIEAAKP